MSKNLTQEIIEIASAMPGVTATEVCQLMSHERRPRVMARLSWLYKIGVLTRGSTQTKANSGRNTVHTYAVNPDPRIKPVVTQRKQQVPSDAGYAAQVAELKAKVAQLEQWRAEALERFPDLATDPIVLKARQLVAATLRENGDSALANDVLAGRKDGIVPVRVAIAALNAA